MNFEKNHKMRGTRPDAETADKIYIVKNVSQLRATYQIRLLLFRALEQKKELILVTPLRCQISADLAELIAEYKESVSVERR